jgi:Uma2 family endonuclease
MAGLVVSPTQRRLLTVEEWAHRADAENYELIDGLLRARMVNQSRHEFAVVRAGRIIDVHLEDHGIEGGVFGSNMKYRVRARRGIMPDLSVVLGDKLDQIEPDAAYSPVGPDLALEVLSPDQESDYLEERLADYWRLETAEVWILNPWERSVSGYVRGGEGYELFATACGDEEFRSRLLPELTFVVSRLWIPVRSRR